MGAKEFLSDLYSRIMDYVAREKPNLTREAALQGMGNKETPEYHLSKLVRAVRKGEFYTNKHILLLMHTDSQIYRRLPRDVFGSRSGKKLKIPLVLDDIIRDESFEIDANGDASKLKNPAYHFGVVYREGQDFFFFEYDRKNKFAEYELKKQRQSKERKPLFGKKEKGEKPADKPKKKTKEIPKKSKGKDRNNITFDD